MGVEWELNRSYTQESSNKEAVIFRVRVFARFIVGKITPFSRE